MQSLQYLPVTYVVIGLTLIGAFICAFYHYLVHKSAQFTREEVFGPCCKCCFGPGGILCFSCKCCYRNRDDSTVIIISEMPHRVTHWVMHARRTNNNVMSNTYYIPNVCLETTSLFLIGSSSNMGIRIHHKIIHAQRKPRSIENEICDIHTQYHLLFWRRTEQSRVVVML